MSKLRLKRDVSRSECPWLDRTYEKGEIVYKYTGATYGVVSPTGIAVCDEKHYDSFFELPKDALENGSRR